MDDRDLTPYAPERSEVESTLHIDFEKNSRDPARVFRAMALLIDAFSAIDQDLIHSIGVAAEPIELLQDIETGSLRAVLRTLVQSTDDEAIRNLDWKKLVGAYLLRGKQAILRRLDDSPKVETRDQVDAIRSDLSEIARETEVVQLPVYQPISTKRLLASVRLLADAVGELGEGDVASLRTPTTTTPINREISLSSERAEELQTRDTITGDSVLILVIKKPDYLGTSMWEFRHGDRQLDAKILDFKWIADFHARKISISPGDALKARVRSEVKYGHDGSIVVQRHFIIEVLEITQVLEIPQESLFVDDAA
ncbi:hypothetical protein [Gemmatimonas sp.]|uniref:hypothetical protein n=1 Tax=Gemmatimonas sp. TaxID=1962908 RepID=UPI003342CB2F